MFKITESQLQECIARATEMAEFWCKQHPEDSHGDLASHLSEREVVESTCTDEVCTAYGKQDEEFDQDQLQKILDAWESGCTV